MERDIFKTEIIKSLVDFNSHAHVERDGEIEAFGEISAISTHTLTWSVTAVAISQFQSVKFQLTRSRGA